ncbi:BrnT family toxin [bacterium]|nr:BrnT family toxin [bacterium]
MVRFEFDPNKSRTNQDKHGIDFIEAQQLWNDPDLIEIPSRSLDEERFMIIGKILEKAWSAIVTYRNNYIRIISVRRSREKEMEIYEKAKSN